ncbi:hypothetical protein TWF481_000520 [Arthrobotrys musiformis]|uniref:Uncharacterized protein n=1 Tax=Arthrobotrys musiformis TaxID=47236 RepID=A0AAV9WMS8_9PEZI
MATLDTAAIRSSNEREVAQYLRKLAGEGDVENTTQQLIGAVERGSIPPSTLKVWLTISHSPAVLKKTLEQDISVRIRKIATDQLQKLLGSSKWKDSWDGLGATEGFIGLFQTLSASDVQDVCKAIGSSTKGADLEKREAITDLFKALEIQTVDTRPLAECYQYLLPGCTKGLVAQVLEGPVVENWNHRQKDLLLRNHDDALRENLLKMVVDYDGPDRPWLFALMDKYPAAPGSKPKSSSTMEFSLEVLRKLVEDNQVPQISDAAFIYEIAEPLLLRCLKKGHVRVEILKEAVLLIVKYIKQHPSVAKVIRNAQPGDSPRCQLFRESKYNEFIPLFEKIAKWWVEMPDIFKDLFCLLLIEGDPRSYGRTVGIGFFNSVLKFCPLEDRYRLLKFCIQYSTLEKDEVEIDFDKGLSRTSTKLTSSGLPDLNPEERLDLFLRLRKARGDEVGGSAYVSNSCSFFTLTTEERGDESYYKKVDLDIWQVVLLQRASRQEEAEELARLRITDRKKAQSTPDMELRSLHARAVMLYAVASGSLSILGEMVNWSKRLIRDSNIRLFYCTPVEIHGILSGIGPHSSIETDASVLQKQVQHGNQIMSNLFDIVCSGLKDPNFQIGNWTEVFSFFHAVALERANRSYQLPDTFSDEEIYTILWEDTLRLLLEVEQKVIGNQQLQDADQSYSKSGIRDFKGENMGPYEIHRRKVHPSTYRFLDALAKGRNDMWQKQRLLKSPSIADLPEIYPRGLPVQYLIAPFTLESPPVLDDLAPYISSRLQAAIFPLPENVYESFPSKNDLTANTLGIFVDDYRYALKLYLSRNIPEEERRTRIDTSWAYATGPLSRHEDRMNADQAIRYWERAFDNVLHPDQKRRDLDAPRPTGIEKFEIEMHKRIFQEDKKWLQSLLPKEKPEPLKMPSLQDPSGTVEWDASPEHKQSIEEEVLGDLTYLDVSSSPDFRELLERNAGYGERYEFPDVNLVPAVPAQKYWHNTIWTRAGNLKVKSAFELQEAQILSALLYLQVETSTPDQLLASPFPSIDDVRYPASKLNENCLSKLSAIEEKNPQVVRRRGKRTHPKTSKDLNSSIKAAFKALEAQISFVPPTLILKLAENAFSRLSSIDQEDPKNDFAAAESLAFNLLRLLARSDRPKLALELAIETISKYPAACFWHKPVFTIGFFRDLSPKNAEDGMTGFIETVLKLLDGMEKAKDAKKTKVADEKVTSKATDAPEEPESSSEADGKLESPKEETGFVKVSTIKLLIELFEDGDFLPKGSSLSTIHSLCKVSSNNDIHKTIVYYLTRVLKSGGPLEPEFFSTLSTIVAKNSEVETYKLILELFNYAISSEKFNSEHQSSAVSVISSIYENSTDIEISKQILKYFAFALDTPLSSDTAVQALFLPMVSKMSKGILDSKLRESLVDYVLHLLKGSTPEGHDQILDVLKNLVSDCSNVNETEPVTEDRWKTFEETVSLPKCDIWNDVDGTSKNPLLLKMTSFHKHIRQNQSLNLAFTERIMIPIIEELKVQSLRYFSIFMQIHGVSKVEQEGLQLAPPRRCIDLIAKVIQNGVGDAIIPLIEEYTSHTLFNINPPDIVQRLNKIFEDDQKLQYQDTVENWWYSYSHGASLSEDTVLLSILRGRIGAPDEETVNACVHEQYLKLYKATFWKETEDLDFEYSDNLFKLLEPKPLNKTWLKYLQPILHDMVQFVASLRTTEWERNPDRVPQILPDILLPQLWLLNIPSQHRNDDDQETRCRVFTAEAIKVLDDISTSFEFTSKVSSVKSVVALTSNETEDDLIITCCLGEITTLDPSSMTIKDYTRVEIASKMLSRRESTKSSVLKERIDNMLKSWKTCQVEEIRRIGYSTSSLELKTPKETPPPKVTETKPKPRSVNKRSGRTKKKTKPRWSPLDLSRGTPKKPAQQQAAWNLDSASDWGAHDAGW